MTLSRRVVLVAATLVVLGAAVVTLVLRFRARSDQPTPGATASRDEASARRNAKTPPTSEELIAAALAAGDLTYDESLLQRAYAIYGDPRVEPQFRSPVVDWESGDRLFHEVGQKEHTLSRAVLDALAPFSVRPNDKTSVFSRPYGDVQPAQNPSAADWVDFLVPGTDVRLWIQGHDRGPLEQTYGPMVSEVWKVFPQFFPHPFGDKAESTANLNPDDATDVYLVHGDTIDLRVARCRQPNPGPACTLAGLGHEGRAPEAPPRTANRSAGYVLADVDQDPDDLLATVAHELAHVTQHNFDVDESNIGGISEATATWVEYKVVKALKKKPGLPYGYLDPSAYLSEALFKTLDVPLTSRRNEYASWLFYFYASTELGNDVVTRIWQRAGAIGFDGIKAVDGVVHLDEHFPKFTVRNWNQDGVPHKYKDDDGTFPPRLIPDPITLMPPQPATTELSEPVPNLAARYYHYKTLDASVRRITFENLALDVPNEHIWALKKVAGSWKPPEDWSKDEMRVLCRDVPADDVSELVLIVSNTDLDKPLPVGHPTPRVLTEEVGCETVEGTAKATLRLNDPDKKIDVTYVASLTTVQFRPRTVQDQAGDVSYDLLPTSVVWSVSGKENDCTVSGQAVVNIPSFIDQPIDPTRPAFGFMNIVTKDGGDFHSITIRAFDPSAQETHTCPGNPPTVTKEPFRSAYLLHILTQANTHKGKAVSYVGQQTFDPDRFQDSLPPAALEVLKNFPQAAAALKQTGGKYVYTFDWELRPRQSGP